MAGESPDRTAILVIHGIGQQKPFETLDQFARNLWLALGGDGARRIVQKQATASREKRERESWQRNYIALEPRDSGHRAVDIHECYWAHRMTGQATIDEILEWFRDISAAAARFYRSNPKPTDGTPRRSEPELNAMFEPQGTFHHNGYLRLLAVGTWVATLLGPRLAAFLAGFGPIANGVLTVVGTIARKFLIDYVGDIVVYTSMDRKAENFPVRQTILRNSRAQLDSLLADERYDRVILAGHSLGSVIAYDILSRPHVDPDAPTEARKVTGLITFGSPLDKIAFFFRDQSDEGAYIRRQVVDHLHSWKRREVLIEPSPVKVEFTPPKNLGAIRWINFFNRKDPISGHLDFFEIDDGDNVPLKLSKKWGLAHIAYWDHAPMYERILEAFPEIRGTDSNEGSTREAQSRQST